MCKNKRKSILCYFLPHFVGGCVVDYTVTMKHNYRTKNRYFEHMGVSLHYYEQSVLFEIST